MLVAFLVLLLMPKVELRTTSASAAARAEATRRADVGRGGRAPGTGPRSCGDPAEPGAATARRPDYAEGPTPR